MSEKYIYFIITSYKPIHLRIYEGKMWINLLRLRTTAKSSLQSIRHTAPNPMDRPKLTILHKLTDAD